MNSNLTSILKNNVILRVCIFWASKFFEKWPQHFENCQILSKFRIDPTKRYSFLWTCRIWQEFQQIPWIWSQKRQNLFFFFLLEKSVFSPFQNGFFQKKTQIERGVGERPPECSKMNLFILRGGTYVGTPEKAPDIESAAPAKGRWAACLRLCQRFLLKNKIYVI